MPATAPSYERPKLLADTLEELELRCGNHGKAAVEHARWGAVGSWLMNLPVNAEERGLLSNPARIAAVAVGLVADDDRARLGLPHHAGRARVSPLNFLSPQAAQTARTVAAETREDWERAGSQHLNRQRIETVHMYMQACAKQEA